MCRAGIAAVLSLMLVGSAVAEKSRLNLFIWSEYIDPDIIKAFEKQNTCKVTTTHYEDNEDMLAKLEAGGVEKYDIIVPSDYMVSTLIQKKLIRPLRKENVSNAKNIDDLFRNPSCDPEQKYSVPYQWGTVGIYVRKPKDKPIDESWGLFFDPARQPGTFVLLDSVREAFTAALKYKGYSINTVDPAQLAEARDLLMEAKKRAIGFEDDVGGKNAVLAKRAGMAICYNGDAARGMAEDAETVYFVPKEGSQIWVDHLCVPAKAPNRDMAEKFINYILDGEVGAKLSNFNQYPSPNKAAKALINPDDLKNPAIYPTEDIMKKLEFLKDLGDNTKLYDESWEQVKGK